MGPEERFDTPESEDRHITICAFCAKVLEACKCYAPKATPEELMKALLEWRRKNVLDTPAPYWHPDGDGVDRPEEPS
jgi:hypothetical protein